MSKSKAQTHSEPGDVDNGLEVNEKIDESSVTHAEESDTEEIEQNGNHVTAQDDSSDKEDTKPVIPKNPETCKVDANVNGNADDVEENQDDDSARTQTDGKATESAKSASATATKKNGTSNGTAPISGGNKKVKKAGPATPKKRKVDTAAADRKEDNEDEATVAPQTPSSSKKRRSTVPATPSGNGRKLPATYEEAEEADKMLWDYRAADRPWKDVRAEWTRITGEVTPNTTLPNRLTRLKANFNYLRPEHYQYLAEVKRDVERQFELDKWNKIIALLRERHDITYATKEALQKASKQLSVQSTAAEVSGATADEED
ncbi:MAG: hypothetical protein M1825_000907 [Sarcosagium campestre]|nr:MAG: hypothetical protein M1825_000907 [Sarcosagium campestre]